MTARRVPLPEGLEGQRVDVALSRLFGVSRTSAAELIETGAVLVDGKAPVKSDRLASGVWLDVTLPEPESVHQGEPELVAGLRIVYVDDDLVVVDKPVGVAAHPSPGWDGPTVTGGLAAAGYRLSTSGAAERQGVVHRLDAGTTGLMVVARSERAYTALKAAFRDRTVDKRYTTLVQGHPDPSRGTIDAPIDRHPTHDYKWAVVAGGRPSVTHYETLEAFRAVRHATAEILDQMTDAQWARQGTHSESGRYSPERWLEIYAPHAHTHAEQIRKARAAA